jgi:hypothetical protein
MSWDLLERMIVDRQWPPKQFGEHLAHLFRATFLTGAR